MSLDQTTKVMYMVVIALGSVTVLISFFGVHKTRSWKKKFALSVSALVIILVVAISIDMYPDGKLDNTQYIDWISSLADLRK